MNQFIKLSCFVVAAVFAASANAADPGVPALPMTRQPPALHLIKPLQPGVSITSAKNPAVQAGMVIHEEPLAHCDFIGNKQAGIALFDGFAGYWYGFGLNAELLFFGIQWGWPGSVPVPGDYDGDRVADLAVFEPDTGLWAVRSVAGKLLLFEQPWGWPGCVPVPGDYDGDGRSDLAFFDPGTARWYIQTSSGVVLLWASAWGWPAAPNREAAVPVPGDYDGDGCADLIALDSRSGRWYVRDVSGKVLAWDEAPDHDRH